MSVVGVDKVVQFRKIVVWKFTPLTKLPGVMYGEMGRVAIIIFIYLL